MNKRVFGWVQGKRSVRELYHNGEIKPIVFGHGWVYLSRVVLNLSRALEASSKPVHPAPG